MTAGGGWSLERVSGPAAELHAMEPPSSPVPTVRELAVDAPALVLGSTQSIDTVDLARARTSGVEVVRRRSGGGAVLLRPGEFVWLDAWVPRGSPSWDDDVARATHWLGATWTRALDRLGFGRGRVHTGGLETTPWSSRVCFAGLGPGEVTVEGRKAVGVSQRRTRDWTRLQSLVHRRWDAEATFGLLADPGRGVAGAEHRDAVLSVGDADLVTTVVTELPVG